MLRTVVLFLAVTVHKLVVEGWSAITTSRPTNTHNRQQIDEESTPFQIQGQGGYSNDDGTNTISAAPSTKNKHTSSAIVRTMMMVGTVTVVGVLLLIMTGHSKMMMNNPSSHAIDGMVVMSMETQEGSIPHLVVAPCLVPPVGTPFGGTSTTNTCEGYAFETCYEAKVGGVSSYCWSKSYQIHDDYCQCAPHGDWNAIDAHYVNPVTLPIRSCGQACGKMDQLN